MADQILTIAHLYPEDMNIYGDRGNILTLAKRAQWRGIEMKVEMIRVGEDYDLARADLLFMGGGQDQGQTQVAADLAKRGKDIKKAVGAGLPTLLICGGYQLFGQYFKTQTGETIPGIGVLDLYTVAGPTRQIGNVTVDVSSLSQKWHFQTDSLVGFENHSGQTYLGTDVEPLGKTTIGQGNNLKDGTEGAVYKNCFGTYLHGSLLPKNPTLADHLLLTALKRKYGETATLTPLDDTLEQNAHNTALRFK